MEASKLSFFLTLPIPTMAHFRAKKLDLGCFITIRTIRDHTKRKVFAEYEPERYDLS